MLLYHGTDLDSALDILNHGLDANKLSNLQAGRYLLRLTARVFSAPVGVRKDFMTKRQYTAADLLVETTATFQTNNDVTTHSHHVRFGRSLTRAEQHLFADVLIRFYHTVYFSRQFGTSLVAEPVVEFLSDTEARYTLRQSTLGGAWKDLLFAILANFSHEVAPIYTHDESRVFDPAYARQPA